MSGAPSQSASPAPSNTLLLRRQLMELTKHPVEGFSAGTLPALVEIARIKSEMISGLVDESNFYEWEVLIIGYVMPLYYLHHTTDRDRRPPDTL